MTRCAFSERTSEYVAMSELVANTIGDLLGHPYFVERMRRRNSSAWQRFVSALRVAHDGRAGGIGKSSQKYLSGLYKRYVKAVDAAEQGVRLSSMVDEEEKEKTPEGASGAAEVKMNMRYSLSKNAKNELHKALYDTNYRSEVKLRDATPDIMISQKGVRNLPMEMNASHIRENIFTEAEAKKLGLKVDDNIHYHGLEFKDANGNVINVPVYINEYANYNKAMIDVNKISTVYGKDAFYNYIRRQIQEKNLVRIKKRSTQAGERSAPIAEGYGMDTSTDIISQNSEKSTENEKKVLDERKSIKHPSFSEKEISNNMEALADMKAVVSIDASKLEKTGKKPKDLFVEFFNSLGNNIYSDVFGDIALSASSAKSEIRHGITAEKIASIEAIPAVIEKGKVIFYKTKKGSDVERVVVAAPIKIGNADYYMGVMLQRDAMHQRLYLHNVVAMKEEALSSQDDSLTNWSDEDNSRLFITSILQKAVNVKIKKQKSNRQLLEPTDERYSKKKAHRKTDVAAVMRAAISKHLRVGDSYGKLLGATAKEAKERLYIELNDAVGKENESAVAFDIADFLIDNAVVEAFESSPEATKNAEAVAKFDAYLHRIDTSGIRDEIRSRFSKDNSVHALWSLRRGYNAIPIETVKAELEKNGVAIDASEPVDVLFEIHNARKAAKEALESTGYALVKNSLSEEEREIARQEIAKDILEGCRVKSLERQAFDVIYDRAKQRAEVWKARYYDEVQKNFITNRLLDKTRKLSDLKLGRFMNATQSKGKVELFKGSIFRLARIRFRGNLNKRGTRKIFATLYAWYTDENNRIVRNSEGKLHDENIAAILARVANNEKPLSDAENAAIDALHKTAAWPLPRGCFVSIFIQIRRYIFSKALIHSRAINSCP